VFAIASAADWLIDMTETLPGSLQRLIQWRARPDRAWVSAGREGISAKASDPPATQVDAQITTVGAAHSAASGRTSEDHRQMRA
jgi:hypothetical protein